VNARTVRHALELVTNVALLILCVVIVFILTGRTVSRSTQKNVSFAWQSGDQFPNLTALSTASHETLVLAISARCSFCEASLPFYARLASADTDAVRIVAVLPESDSEARGFVKRIGSDLTALTGQNFRDLRIEGTPTLILLDSKRKVEKVWTGKLSSGQEQEVLKTVQHSGRT
jgi:hypothetical protein